MDNGMTVLSYALATVASVCFLGGVAILSGGRVKQHGTIRDHHRHVRRIIRH